MDRKWRGVRGLLDVLYRTIEIYNKVIILLKEVFNSSFNIGIIFRWIRNFGRKIEVVWCSNNDHWVARTVLEKP